MVADVISHPQALTVRVWQFGEVVLPAKHGGRLDRLCAELKLEFPGLVMQFKSRHWYWGLLHWVVLIFTFGGNRRFIQKYTSTFRKTIGWSKTYEQRIRARTANWEDRVWSCLMHEREHLRQFERYGMFVMTLSYVFVFFPVGLSYCRARLELAGYRQTLRCWYLLDLSWARSEEAKKWWIGQFTSGAYGWAWPFKKTVTRWFETEMTNLDAMAVAA